MKYLSKTTKDSNMDEINEIKTKTFDYNRNKIKTDQ